mmetsp:Transcript_29428/g.64448  ORF Transcript_29428/g.64448 Transcript_29428/m.64448 type:complete len:229 (+) Transcript_29428:11417-12103(+)
MCGTIIASKFKSSSTGFMRTLCTVQQNLSSYTYLCSLLNPVSGLVTNTSRLSVSHDANDMLRCASTLTVLIGKIFHSLLYTTTTSTHMLQAWQLYTRKPILMLNLHAWSIALLPATPLENDLILNVLIVVLLTLCIIQLPLDTLARLCVSHVERFSLAMLSLKTCTANILIPKTVTTSAYIIGTSALASCFCLKLLYLTITCYRLLKSSWTAHTTLYTKTLSEKYSDL